MDAKELPAYPNLEQYKKQAKDLVKARKSGDPETIQRIRKYHPRWSRLKDSEISSARLALTDAQLVIAREHGFESWPKFAKHLEAVSRQRSPISKFELAADAVIAGDTTTLERLLGEDPNLIRARSTRAHRSTLLHYVAANGVEDFRQKTPKNAVEVAKILLRAGAEVDAENYDYGGGGTTLGLVATSYPPARAGLQIALLETLLEAGASVDGLPGAWNPGRNPLTAALANGRGGAAEFLSGRSARLDLEGAAGVGRLDVVKSFFHKDGSLRADATPEQIKSGFAWACEFGRTSVVDFLLGKGIAVDAQLRHHGQTGLHWAAYGAHAETVQLLLKRKAPVDAKDASYHGTPLGWALYAWGDPPPEAEREGYYAVVALLVAAGATVDPAWLADPGREQHLAAKVNADPRMVAALRGEMQRWS